MSDRELLPCAHCGSVKIDYKDGDFEGVVNCQNCGSMIRCRSNVDGRPIASCIRRWNARTAPTQTASRHPCGVCGVALRCACKSDDHKVKELQSAIAVATECLERIAQNGGMSLTSMPPKNYGEYHAKLTLLKLSTLTSEAK